MLGGRKAKTEAEQQDVVNRLSTAKSTVRTLCGKSYTLRAVAAQAQLVKDLAEPVQELRRLEKLQRPGLFATQMLSSVKITSPPL